MQLYRQWIYHISFRGIRLWNSESLEQVLPHFSLQKSPSEPSHSRGRCGIHLYFFCVFGREPEVRPCQPWNTLVQRCIGACNLARPPRNYKDTGRTSSSREVPHAGLGPVQPYYGCCTRFNVPYNFASGMLHLRRPSEHVSHLLEGHKGGRRTSSDGSSD